MEVQIFVSVGELLDKFSILSIKKERITNETSRQKVIEEIDSLCENVRLIRKNEYINYLYLLLYYINSDIWELTDQIRESERKGSNIVSFSFYSECFRKNEYRYRLKKKIDLLSNSKFQEQKEEREEIINLNSIVLSVERASDILRYNDKIHFYASFYNQTVIVIPERYHKFCEKILSNPFVTFSESFPEGIYYNIRSSDCPNPFPGFLEKYNLRNTKGKILNYLIGGRLGDMVHCLYVIFCNYLLYGIRGNLIITNNTKHLGDTFLKNPDEMVDEIKDIFVQQEYLSSFERNDNDDIDFDINLNLFRKSPLLYTHNWNEILSDTFGFPLQKRSFIHYFSKSLLWNDLRDFVLIHRKTTEDRRCEELTPFLQNIVSKNKCLYIYFEGDINAEFGQKVSYLEIPNLKELVPILQNAKFCISNQTGILAFAFALGIPCLCEHNVEKAYIGHEKYQKNFFWISKEGRSENFEEIKNYISF